MITEKDYIKLAHEILGVKFKDINLLITAFTHRSWLNENRRQRGLEHNERLEFLGDAVLELATTEFLYAKYDEPEGVLTNWRSALVRTESIGAAAERMGFWEYLRLARGEKQGSERARAQILANSFEAVIGAVYLDQGYEAAVKVIQQHIFTTLDEILRTGSWMDSKSRLQELAQARVGYTPHYRVLSEDGPDHDKIFEVGVYLGDQMYGSGKGPSKQIAQQAAAEGALEKEKLWKKRED